MTITDADRHRLHTALEGVLGEQDAAVLMSHLPPSGWSDVARTADLDQLRSQIDARFTLVDQRFEHLEARIDERFARIDERFDHLEARIDERFARIDERFDHLEARFTQRLDQMDARFTERFEHGDEKFEDRFTLMEARLERTLATSLREQTNRTIVAFVAILTSVGLLLQLLSP